MSKSALGKVLTEDTKKKISDARKNKPKSDKTRKKMSEYYGN